MGWITSLLAAVLLAEFTPALSMVTVNRLSSYYDPDYVVYRSDPCYPNPCGVNSQCQVNYDRPVCSCLPQHFGDPFVSCKRGECDSNADCPLGKTCRNNNCENPCLTSCGINAECNVRNHVAVCSCPPHHTGNPFERCRRFDPEELCHPSPCGVNTDCKVVNNVPVCTCRPGFKGQPLSGCNHECEYDGDCQSNQVCDQYHCRNACANGACGEGANCNPVNHRAVCTCPEGYIGDAFTRCRPECTYNSDCPGPQPVCYYNRCSNPCKGACGINANCDIQGNKAVCSCPRNMTGDPFTHCRPFEKTDLCHPNPCGTNAQCQPGKDNTGADRPVCTCLPGYLGDALSICRRGECLTDSDCPSNKACNSKYECHDPCVGSCGISAQCTVRNHVALCACPPGYTGDASSSCRALPYDTTATGRRYYSGRSYYPYRNRYYYS